MHWPVVGIVGFQEEDRFGSALGQQPVSVPGGAVHRADHPFVPFCAVPVNGVFQHFRAGVGVGSGVVSDQAGHGRRAAGVAGPPQRTTCEECTPRVL